MARLGIGFTGVPYSTKQIIGFAREAEVSGFESIWIAEDYFLRDAFTLLSAIAVSTSTIKLGTGVVNPYTRNPVLIAQSMATLDEVSGGRTFLALGTGVGPLIEQAGIKFEKPLTRVRESVEVIRALLSGNEVTFSGTTVKVEGITLGENPYFRLLGSFKPPRNRIPIYVAAIGSKMLELAGQISDGVLLTAGCSPLYVRHAIERVRTGVERTGRNYSDIDIAALILTSYSEQPRERLGLKGFLAYSLSFASREYLEISGVDEDEVKPVRKAFLENGIEAAAVQITDKILNNFSACGDIDTCMSTIRRYIDAGIRLPIILPIDTDVSKLIHAFRAFT